MTLKRFSWHKLISRDEVIPDLRKKLGVSQDFFAELLGVSRSLLALVERKKRSWPSKSLQLILKLHGEIQSLEDGSASRHRSVETRLFINDAYRTALPKMKFREEGCRIKIKMLQEQLEAMKLKVVNAEHAIIIFTKMIATEAQAGAGVKRMQLLEFMKQDAYKTLLKNWEPQQAKIHAKIEAAVVEARSLKRFRLQVMKAHQPFKSRELRAVG